ncbi:MAG: phage baseplate assembly protein V [Gammaproteobacteria bacterium]|nr:phage baseplate assembly protein V [Gammaproteobacteria bacterium]MDH5651697.1 phage baseplate assembly protein V [Gammaproteobacteria bacterium]
MTENNLLEISELQRRLFTMIQIGVVDDVNHAEATVRVNIDGVLTAYLPWLCHKAGSHVSWWAPEKDEQVLILSIGGELSNGVVLPAIYQAAHLTGENTAAKHHVTYSDGTSISYDSVTHELNVNVNGGNVTLNTSGNVTVNVGGDANITAGGNVNVDGSAVNFNGGGSGGVVCQTHVCAFTGSPHPQGSTTVKGGG